MTRVLVKRFGGARPAGRPQRHRRLRLAGATLVAVLVLTAAACGDGGDTYQLTARFPEAIALYDDSDVKVMGVTIGSVTDISIDGDSILVKMAIDKDAPLPSHATVSIMPSSLLGERVVNFSPAWKPGDEKMTPGTAIPDEQTMVPVEPDEALESITDLLTSLRPESVARILEEGSKALDGNGAKINSTLLELSQIIPYLAEQDDEFNAIADDIHVLAEAVRSRDDEIAKLLEDFATVSTALAEERDQIIEFVNTLASLSREGRALLTAYEETIPDDLDTVAQVALTIEANAQSVQQTLLSFQGFQSGVIDAWLDEHGTIHARVMTSESTLNQLQPILDLLSGVSG